MNYNTKRFNGGNLISTCRTCSADEPVETPCNQRFGIEGRTVAALYIPIQAYEDVYDLQTGLTRGTIFASLDKPFFGGKGVDCRGRT